MVDLPVSTQEKIIADFKTNQDVFAQVYDFYFELIFRFLLKRTMSPELAYDLTAETFLKAFRSFGRFQWKGFSIKVWLFRIAINEFKNHHRKPKLFFFPDFEHLENRPSHEIEEELKVLNESLFEDPKLVALGEAINKLSPRYKNVVSLFYFTGLSQAEIALAVNRSPGAVKAMLHRAVTQLRSQLKPLHSSFL